MAEIVNPIVEGGTFVSVAPADGILGGIADDGSVAILEAWDPVQGDVFHTAPAGSAVGGGTRRHLFDREVYVDTVGDGSGYVNVRAYTSITGKPTTVQGFGITNAIRTDLGAVQNIDDALTLAGAVTITTNATHFTGKTAGAVSKRLIGVNASGLVAIDADAAGATFGAGGVFAGAITPGTDAAYDHGGGSFRWRDGYYSRNVTIGGTVTVSGSISVASTSAGNLGLFSTTNTGVAYHGMSNFGGSVILYTDSSTGGNAFAASGAYSSNLIGAAGKQLNLVIGTTGVLSFTSGGAPTVIAGITSTLASGSVFQNTAATTGTLYMAFTNTSGTAFWGVESSTGGSIFPGSTAYATVLGTSTAKPVQFFTNNALALTIASGGVVTATGNILAGTDAAFDLGGVSNRWRDLKISRDATIGGTITVTGAISVTGAAVQSNLGTTPSASSASVYTLRITNTTTGSGVMRILFYDSQLSDITGSIDSVRTGPTAGTVVIRTGNGTQLTDAVTINSSQNVTVAGVLTVQATTAQFGSAGGNILVTIGAAAPAADNGGRLVFQNTNTGRNWQLDNNQLVGDAFCITPSTAGGGTSYTTPLFRLQGAAGTINVGGAVLTITDAAHDLGSSSKRFRDGWFSRDVSIAGTLTVGTLALPALSFTAATLTGGFTASDGEAPAHALTAQGEVVLKGNLGGGGGLISGTAFTLPSGRRPVGLKRYLVYGNDFSGNPMVMELNIQTSGAVQILPGPSGNTYASRIHLDGISFSTT